MKKIVPVFVAVLSIVIVSCQKEIDWGTDSPANQQLVKIHSKTGSDSTVITYGYDGQKRLTSITTVGASGAITLDDTLTINRNSSGIITSTVQKSAMFAASGLDSILRRFNYNSSTNRYTSAVYTMNLFGFDVTDSAIFNYDGSGRIVSETHYIGSSLIPFFPALKNDYTYSSNGLNLVGMAQLAAADPSDPLSGVASQDYTFDSKTNPLIIKNEGILLGQLGLYNANNATKFELNNSVDPTQSFTMDYIYKYNSFGKPDSSYGTRTPGGEVTASKYFYQ